jgi:hypothetical protein
MDRTEGMINCDRMRKVSWIISHSVLSVIVLSVMIISYN